MRKAFNLIPASSPPLSRCCTSKGEGSGVEFSPLPHCKSLSRLMAVDHGDPSMYAESPQSDPA